MASAASEFFLGKKSGFTKTSLLDKGQQNTLNMYSGLTQQYMPQTTGALANLALKPQSAYQSLPNWEQDFQSGVVRPGDMQLRNNLAGLQASPERHSSFRRTQEQNMRQDFSNQIAQQRYNQMMQERQMQQSGMENAFQRQQNALGEMNNLYSTGLNRNAVQNQYNEGSTGLLGGMLTSMAGKATSYMSGGLFGS
jgi:hypothetical protein